MRKQSRQLRFGLTGKVVLTMVAVVLMLLFIMATVSHSKYETFLMEQIERELLLKSDQAVLEVTRQFELKGNVVRQLAEQPVTLEFLTEQNASANIPGNPHYTQLERMMTTIQETDESIGMVWVSHTESSFMAADHQQIVEEAGVTERPWFAEAEANGGVTYSSPYEDLLTKKLTVSLIHPVMEGEDRIGYAGLDIHLVSMLQLLRSIDTPEQQLLIMSDEGFIVYDPSELRSDVSVNELPDDKMIRIDRGEDDLFVRRKLVPELDWSIVSAVPETVAFAPLADYRRFSIVMWTTGVLLILLTIALVLRRQLRDIPSLLADIRKAENPDYAIKAGIHRKDEIGEIARTVGRLTSIIHADAEEKNYRSLHDSLTGLPNRRYLEETVERWIREAQGRDELIAVAFIDLDRLKQINDINGHSFGDELLIRFSDRLRKNSAAEAFGGRFSGDEFIVLFKTKPEEMTELHLHLTELLAELVEPYEIRRQLVYVAASVGVATYPFDASNKEELMVAADTALVKSKEEGPNRILFFNGNMKRTFERQAGIDNGLRTAVENGEFELYFQPQVDLKTRKVCGLEALLRWNHPESGLILPGDFIPVAETSGQIFGIDEWVIEESISKGIELINRHPEIQTISINVNAQQLQNGQLAEKIGRLLDAYDFPASRLEIEITETVIMAHLNQSLKSLHDLKKIGVTVALDDFGTGYSSLNYLRVLPIDRLKIDRAFISRMEEDKRMQKIVKMVISLARSLGMKVIAEGAEQESELQLLESWGADIAQGYSISRPLPVEELLRFLEARRAG